MSGAMRIPGSRSPRPRLFLLFVLVLLGGCSSGRSATDSGAERLAEERQAAGATEHPRNIILFISDGCGPASFTMAREFLRTERGQNSLALDDILVGSVQTYATDKLITDSASSATAYACGVKTRNGMIGMAPDSTELETILELAHASGMATGLVATSRITHATPASFASHVINRNMESEIAAQEMKRGVDVILGGGRRFFLPQAMGGSRTDGRDLLSEARAAGYTVIDSIGELDHVGSVPVVGLFGDDHLPYEIDRDPARTPSLARMTERAIELLSTDPDGFFLMVEGSRIDHAAHENDVASHLHDIVAYDEAVAVGLRFARRDRETMVVSVSDHETGGLTLGRRVDGISPYEWKPDLVGHISASSDSMIAMIYDRWQDPEDVLRDVTGITDLSDEERADLKGADRAEAHFVLGAIVGRRAFVGWTTGGHTAVDVNLYAYGPGSEALRGHLDNAELGRIMIGLLQ